MKLDAAIKHYEEKAKELRKKKRFFAIEGKEKEWGDCLECAEEHEQLAGWLRELADYRANYSEKNEKMTDEELEKFREELRNAPVKVRAEKQCPYRLPCGICDKVDTVCSWIEEG